MSALYMLDTDIASYIIKGHSPAIEARLAQIEPSMACVSAIPGHRLYVAVRQFLEIVRAPPWDSEAADFYADLRHQLVTTGQVIGDMDMMIAAHSLAKAAVLVTNNTRHYERISAPLMLQNWSA